MYNKTTICDADGNPINAATNENLALLIAALGGAGDVADVDGNQHSQLRYIGENIDQVHIEVDDLDAIASWAASTDASGIAQETIHVPDHSLANSLSFDKAAGTVVEASYGKTIDSTDASVLGGDALITWFVKHGDFTNVASVFIRLGTDASNYNQYGMDPVDFSTTLWNHITMPLHEGVQTGTGLNLSAITYVAFGVIMDAAGNTIADVFFNDVELHSINVSELQTGDVTANAVRVSRVGSNAGAVWPKDSGNKNTGTPRVVIATDDINLAAQTALLGKMYPTDDVANADDTAGNAVWAEIPLAANTIFVDFSLAGACRIEAGNTTPTGAIGNIYQPNITFRKATPFGKLWAYGISAAHAVYSTSATRV